MWPPITGLVASVERTIDDYVWSNPGTTPNGPCQTLAALSPFWAVRRLSASVLAAANTVFEKAYKKSQSFNCSLQTVRITNVSVGTVAGVSLNTTRIVSVPFITNHVAVEAGEELLLEIRAAAPKAEAKQNANKAWKREVKKQGTVQKKEIK